MNKNRTTSNWATTLRGLIHMRICELATVGTAVRYAIAFSIVFGLTVFVGTKSPHPEFWNLAIYVFALGFLPIYCLVKGGESLRNEIKEGTIEFLWTRPVGKPTLFLGFYFSSLVSVLAFTTLCLAALVAAGYWLGEIESLSQVTAYSVGCVIIGLSFTALSLSLSSLSSKFIVLGIVYYFLVEKLLSQLPTSVRSASIVANLRPHLLSLSENAGELAFSNTLQSIVHVTAITAVALAIGCAAFTLKSYSLGEDK